MNAVNGATLAQEAPYDREKAIRLFNRELSKGELGCALSHLAVYDVMVSENIPHALVLEDDANILDPKLSATLSKLATLYPPETPVVVLLNHVPRYDGNKKADLDDGRCVYDAYRGVGAHAYFITRAAAKILGENLYPVYVVADKWEYFQERFIEVKALVPYSVGLSSFSLSSTIDVSGKREKKAATGGNYVYYARRYWRQLLNLVRYRPFIRIEQQKKSEFDLN